MQAVTVLPGIPHSAELRHVPEPPLADGSVLVRTLSIGVCGTDAEILAAEYGSPPPSDDFLILGHESLGLVADAPPSSPFRPGDLVTAIVRRPDHTPCPSCASGEWDFCSNGLYTERGIKGRHGFASDRFRCEPEFLVPIPPALGPLGVLVEPATTAAKAWEQIDRIAIRSLAKPQSALITGAGPIGLLNALFASQRGLAVHVLDLAETGLKPELAGHLGASYSSTFAALPSRPSVIVECTGAPTVIAECLSHLAPNGILCLIGVSSSAAPQALDAAALSRSLLLENKVVFGSVNANRRHFETAVSALLHADPRWLSKLITRRVPLERWSDALHRLPTDVKVVIDFSKG